ncbi:hypothetical protein [Bacillus aquiflavi]|uniref:hypothetical protein n=1 Tax=Bacillus aquiflavi TaxID=2672567 RepID=UPI001FE4195B|nr:hypothetical protein [Bacillus aquiflavi]
MANLYRETRTSIVSPSAFPVPSMTPSNARSTGEIMAPSLISSGIAGTTILIRCYEKLVIDRFESSLLFMMKSEAYRKLFGSLVQKVGLEPINTVKRDAYGNDNSIKYHVYADGLIVMEADRSGKVHYAGHH